MAKIIVTKIREKFYSAQVNGILAVGNNKAKALRRLQRAVEIKEKEAEKVAKKFSDVADRIDYLATKIECFG